MSNEPFVPKGAVAWHPHCGKPKEFGFDLQVKADPEAGTVVWPNGADMCPDVLYARSVPLKLPEELGA